VSVSAAPGDAGQARHGTVYNPATEPKRPDATLGELLSEVTSDISSLFRQEIELAKLEAKQEATNVGKASALLGGAAIAGLLALVLLSMALAWLLDQGLNRASAFAIVGGIWTLLALVLQRTGRARLARVHGLPNTRETIKEDIEWATTQTS
jgi:hypothetical protein